MKHTLLLPAASAIAVAAMALASPATGQTPQPSQAPRAETQTTNYTDAQLRSYAAAKAEIDRLGAQRTDAQTAPILQRHNIDAATYAAIARASASDRTLAQRIASLQTQTRTP